MALFGNYKFLEGNHERVEKIYCQLLEKENTCHPLDVFFKSNHNKALKVSKNTQEADDKSNVEASNIYDVIDLCDDSEKCSENPNINTSYRERINVDYQSDRLDLDASMFESQLSQGARKRRKIEVLLPDLLIDFQDDVMQFTELFDNNDNMMTSNVSFINCLSSEQVEVLLKFVSSQVKNEELFTCIFCSIFVTNTADPLSYNCGMIFIHMSLFPMLLNLKQNASREIFGSLLAFFNMYPLLLDCLLSAIASDSNAVKSAFINDLLVKIIKDVSDDSSAFRNVLQSLQTLHENFFPILQLLIEKCAITADDLNRLVHLIDKSNVEFTKNLKFAKLLARIIQLFKMRFGDAEKAIMLKVVEANKTFLKKSLENSLKK